MTPDDFTEAARAEAERRHVPLDRPTAVTERCAVQGFQDGAEWARDRLTTQEPTDEEVEAALYAFIADSNLQAIRNETAYPDLRGPTPPPPDRRKSIRAALRAARRARHEEGER